MTTAFRNTIGLPGTLSVRLQPNHPTDDLDGVTASIIDGLLYGCGDAVIGINPVSDSLAAAGELTRRLDEIIQRFDIPTQGCVLTHVTSAIALVEQGAPVDLVFQSIAGTEAANASFGVSLALLREGLDAGRSLKRGTVGDNVMYFETGQGAALSAEAQTHHGLDQQTVEARAYAVARAFDPLLVNTVVGFIGPEYLYDGKQIIRAGLEDHFCGKLMGLPMGCDVCYTNHAEADQDDMDNLLTLLGTAGVDLHHGGAGSRRCDAELPVHLVSRRPLCARTAGPETGAGIRSLAGADGAGRLRRPPADRRADAIHALLAGRLDMKPPPATPTPRDPWARLSGPDTRPRVALGRTGVSLPTREVLGFALDHARARDAVHRAFDAGAVAAQVEAAGLTTVTVNSAAPNRSSYLRRPDLGRRPIGRQPGGCSGRRPADTVSTLPSWSPTVCPAAAVPRPHAAPPHRRPDSAHRAGRRLASGKARWCWPGRDGWLWATRSASGWARAMVVMLIGERPGMSSPDSLGVYLTFAPQVGRTDAERNCISNIRPAGLSYDRAAQKIAWHIKEALRRGLTGVALKDESDLALISEQRAIGD